jgi:molybdopterin molybdotransferase
VAVSAIDPARMRALAVASVSPLAPRPVELLEAAGLVLAQDVVAAEGLPRFDNAAMDGHAVRSADTLGAPVRLRVTGHAYAGRGEGGSVGPGAAVAIATGAPIPAGADAVAPLEETEVDGEALLLRSPVRAGANVRGAGEDVAPGTVLVPAGVVIGPGQAAAAAACGLAVVTVHPRPRVAILPTGDEVRPAGGLLGPGQVFDAASAPLAMLVREAGGVACPAPVAPDEPAGLLASLRAAAAAADAVVTVGGVSMGERDLVRALQGRGCEVRSFEVALRPAKPFALGRAFGVPLFGLPGNPAAALASFEELVRPALLAMLGRAPLPRPSARATLAEPIRQRPGRLHLVRAEVWRDGDRLMARASGRQGAGMIHSLAASNAWAVIPPEAAELPAGAEVEVRLLTDPR